MAWCGVPPSLADWLLRWNTHPAQMILLAVILLLGLAATSGSRRRDFAFGWLVLVVAFVSPLCALTSALFSARVLHHLLIALIAAPLLARAFTARAAGGTGAASACFLVVMVLWHWPAAYVLSYDTVAGYWAMQVSLLFASVWLWRTVLAPVAELMPGLVALAVVSAGMGMLGAILTFAPIPLYPPHLGTTGAFGLTALEDQQLGGLLMWVPGILPFAAAGLMLARTRFGRLAVDA